MLPFLIKSSLNYSIAFGVLLNEHEINHELSLTLLRSSALALPSCREEAQITSTYSEPEAS